MVLKRCVESTFILNWGKVHLLVYEGIVLGHKIIANLIEVDQVFVDVIAKFPPLILVKGVRSFLGYDGL